MMSRLTTEKRIIRHTSQVFFTKERLGCRIHFASYPYFVLHWL